MKLEPISFTGRLSLADWLDIHRFHSRVVIRRSIRLLMSGVSLAIALLIIVTGLRSHVGLPAYIVLALCVYFPFGWMFLDRLLVRRRYARDRDAMVDTTVTFTDENVSTTNTTSDIRLSWSQVSMIVATPRGLLFLLPPHHVWFYLPQRLFCHNSQREAVLGLAAANKITIREMT